MEHVTPLSHLMSECCLKLFNNPSIDHKDLDDAIREHVIAWLNTQNLLDRYYPPENITD